jgi:hypothetical protein
MNLSTFNQQVACPVLDLKTILKKHDFIDNESDKALNLNRSAIKAFLVAIGYLETNICDCVQKLSPYRSKRVIKYLIKISKIFHTKYVKKMMKGFDECNMINTEDLKNKLKSITGKGKNDMLTIVGLITNSSSKVFEDQEELSPSQEDIQDDLNDTKVTSK